MRLFFLLFVSISFYGQQKFVSADYIDKYNLKHIGQVQEVLDYSTFKSINFKEVNGAVIEINLNDLNELNIGNDIKFKRFNVGVDVNLHLNSNENKLVSKYINENLLLQILVVGDYSLYSTYIENRKSFFIKYKTDDVPKSIGENSYILDDDIIVEKKNIYKRQLLSLNNCSNSSAEQVEKMNYETDDFLSFFKSFYNCYKSENEVTYYNVKPSKGKFKIKFTSCVGYSTYTYSNKGFPTKIKDVKNNLNFSIGLETRLVFPDKKNECILKIDYESVNSLQQTQNLNETEGFEELEMKSGIINFNLGPRYNFILKNKNSIYVDFTLGFSTFLNTIKYSLYLQSVVGTKALVVAVDSKPSTVFNFNLGFGYEFNSKIGLDFRYRFGRSFLPDGVPYTSSISSFNTSLKYTFN